MSDKLATVCARIITFSTFRERVRNPPSTILSEYTRIYCDHSNPKELVQRQSIGINRGDAVAHRHDVANNNNECGK